MHDAVDTDYRVMHKVCAPAVAPLHPREIHRVAVLHLTDIDAIVAINGVYTLQ